MAGRFEGLSDLEWQLLADLCPPELTPRGCGMPHAPFRMVVNRRGMRPQILKRVWKSKPPRGRPIKQDVPRFQAERTFAWFQKKYRRLVVRWERLALCFAAFLVIATIHIWIHRLIVG